MRFIGAAILLLISLSARAQLLGSTVDVTARYPDVGSIYTDGGVAIVGPDIEYPAGSFASYNASWQVDITGNQMLVTNTDTGFDFTDASFNGFVLTVLSGPTLLSAAVDPASGFAPIDISLTGGNQLALNFAGVTSFSGGPLTAVIDLGFATAVPEAENALMLLAGLTLLGFRVARRGRGLNPNRGQAPISQR
jgi:hypothetical protein